MLYENGLKDSGFAQIIEGITALKTVKSLSYFGNELGMDSIEKLEELVENRSEQVLKDLRFGYLKSTPKCLLKLFEVIGWLEPLEKLRISGQKLTDIMF